ncbi:hypothetical protein H5410_040656, partial [Solanum commersonii]
TEKLKKFVILYVVGTESTIASLERFIASLWNFAAKPEFCYHNEGYFMVLFDSMEERIERALSKIGSGLEVPIYADNCTTHTEELCFRNCSRVAYAKLDIAGTNEVCLLWFDELVDIREFDSSGQDIYIKLDSSETEIST